MAADAAKNAKAGLDTQRRFYYLPSVRPE